MTSRHKNIEGLFSEAFDRYEHNIDRETAWAAVEETLHKKKKTPFPLVDMAYCSGCPGGDHFFALWK